MKLDVQGQGGGRILDVDGQGGWGVLKIEQYSWTSFVYHPLLLFLKRKDNSRSCFNQLLFFFPWLTLNILHYLPRFSSVTVECSITIDLLNGFSNVSYQMNYETTRFK